MIHFAIFDIDGTLLDTSPMWAGLGERFLCSRGITPRGGLSDRLLRLSLEEGAELLRREYLQNETAAYILNSLKCIIDDFYRYEAAAKRGAPELLQALSERGISMSLATGGDKDLSRAALERLGLMRYFKGLASCGEYGGKHSPAVFLAAARIAGGTAAETLVFEDSLHAAQTAKRAGFKVAAVRDIGEPRQEELRAVADHYADDLTEYAEIIDKLIK